MRPSCTRCKVSGKVCEYADINRTTRNFDIDRGSTSSVAEDAHANLLLLENVASRFDWTVPGSSSYQLSNMGPPLAPPPPDLTSDYTETDTATATDVYSEYSNGMRSDGLTGSSRLAELYNVNHELFQPFFSDVFSDIQFMNDSENNFDGGVRGEVHTSSNACSSPDTNLIGRGVTPPLERWPEKPGAYPGNTNYVLRDMFQFPTFDMSPNQQMLNKTADLGIEYAKKIEATGTPPQVPISVINDPSNPPLAMLGQFREYVYPERMCSPK